MRNLKKLLAVIVAICVLATFTVPAFAETKTDAEIATELGVIRGTGDGVTAEYLATQPDRLQGAIMLLRLMGLEDEAKAFTGTDNFADVAGLNADNKAIVAYLKAHPELGYGDGIGGGKFGPTLKMEAKQYYKIMLVALGYTYGTDNTADFTWANVMSFAASKGLVKMADVTKFTVNDLCKATVEALKATVKGGTQTFIAKLVADGNIAADKAASTGLFVAADVALTATVNADTLKTAKVVFNKEIDADTVTVANFSNSDITSTNAPVLLEDKKTVLLVFQTTKAQSATTDVVIENVKATDGTTIAKVTKTITFVDTTIPVITGAIAKNAKTIIISTSEPMSFAKSYYQSLSEVKINGINSIAKSDIDFAKNTITLTLNANLAAGTHKVDISGIKDFANYTAVATSFNVDVSADTTAPSMVSAKMNNINEVEVTFSEDIDEINKGDFYVNGTKIVTATQQVDRSVFKLTLPASATLNTSAIVEVKVEYQYQKDVVGNQVVNKTAFTFKVDDDTTLPTVTAAIDSSNKLTLTFSKTMLANAGTITVKKASDGAVLRTISQPFTFKANTNNTVIELTSSANGLAGINPTDIIVNVKDMKDATVRTNIMVAQDIPLKANDTLIPIVNGYFTYAANTADPSDDTVTFYFSEAMDNTTLNNLSNYVALTTGGGTSATNGALSAQGTSVKSIAADGKSITIVYPGFAATGVAAGTTFQLFSLKDTAGNPIAYPSVVNDSTGVPIATIAVSSITAKSSTTIEVVFNSMVSSIDPSAFIVTGTAANVSYACTQATLDDTKTIATLTFYPDMGTTFGALNLDTTLNSGLVSNVYGSTLGAFTVGGRVITDGVKPIASVASTSVTTQASITITFSEVVNVSGITNLKNALFVTKSSDAQWLADLATTDGAVKFFNGDVEVTSTAALSGTDFTKVMVTSAAGIVAGTEYKVSIQPWNITDNNGNVITYLAPTAVTP